MEKLISLTFDYEVFLYRSGTPEKCILEPVDRLIELFDKTGIKATFFIDSLYYKRLCETPETLFQAEKIRKQLQLLVNRGQRIELHLHPIWLDAVYNNGQWNFPDYRYYRIDALDHKSIKDLFLSQTALLNDIAHEIDKKYSVMAYRAGGLCIEPFFLIKEIFSETGLVIDSSVAYNTFHLDGIHDYDFRNSPQLECYRFSENTGLIDDKGSIYEYPITTYKINILDKIINKVTGKLLKNEFRIYGDGGGISMPTKRSILDKLLPVYSMFSLEGISAGNLLRKIDGSKKKIINMISHPKLMSRSSYNCIEKMYSKGFKFMNLKQIHDYLEETGNLK